MSRIRRTIHRTLFVGLAAFPPASAPGQPAAARVMLETKAVSLAEMTAKADRIFLGQVKEVREVEETPPGAKRPWRVRRTTFAVERVLKGGGPALAAGKDYTVRQYAELCRPVEKGERLLWYLAPDSRLGFTQPVGVDSGHFQVLTDPDGRAVAINLKANEDLLDAAAVRREVNELADVVRPNTEAGRLRFVEQVRAWADDAEKHKAVRAAPLDLILGKTQKLLQPR